jgi:hypothetical protein
MSTPTGKNFAIVKLDGSQPEVDLFRLDVDGQEIIGVARLDKKLYVVCVNYKSDPLFNGIYVFEDDKSFTRSGVIKIDQLDGFGPGDIVSDGQYLYLIDWQQTGSRLWKVDPGERCAELLSTLVPGHGWTGTLAMSNDSKRLMGVSSAGINLLNIESKTLETLSLPADTVDPQHAIQLQDGSFYVTEGWNKGQVHRVRHISADGKRVLAETDGGNIGKFNWPRYLTFGPDGQLFLLDYNNRRIVKSDADLANPGVLVNAGEYPGFGWPQRMLGISGNNPDDGSFKLYVALAEKSCCCECDTTVDSA